MIIERHYNLYYVYENDQYCHNYFMFEYFHDFFLNHCEKIELKEKINSLIKDEIKEGIIIIILFNI